MFLVLASATASATKTSGTDERRGPMLEMVAALIAEGHDSEALAVFAKLLSRNNELERRLAEVLGRGRKSEGVSAAQLRLLLDGLAQPGDEALKSANEKLRDAAGVEKKANDEELKADKPPRQPPVRRELPAGLRRVDNPLPVPAAERPCPTCGKERVCIGHDVTEVVDIIPAEVIVRLDKREKLGCEQCEGEIVRAPQGDKVVSGGRLGSKIVGELVVDKYRDGLPLHREKQRFERLGLSLPISTLADQVTWATDLLRPLWRGAMTRVLGAAIMHIDGTSLPVLDRDSAAGIRLGTLWGCVGDRDTALYLYASTGKKNGQREGEIGPEDLLALRTGLVVADAAGTFEASFNRPDLIECGCNMHGRRYFKKALDRGDERAALPIAAFKKLYEIEEKIRDLGDEAKRSERQQHSKPVYDELCAWAETYRLHEPPSSPLGAALRYLHNHEVALRRFLEDGRIPIDNGIVERLHVRAADWGSLCVPPSSAWNLESAIVARISTRAAPTHTAAA